MSGRPKKGRKKRSADAHHGDSKYQQDSDTSRTPYQRGKTKPSTQPEARQCSVFFGYDLPDDITEEDILSFLEEFQQCIVSVEVVLNERNGNYAKVTFATHSDAQAAMNCYSNQPWYDIGVNVTLKPWKDRETASSSKKHKSFPLKSGADGRTKPTATDSKPSSVFFGYDLPDYITEDDILSFLEEYEQSIVSVEVELNVKHGNYAKVTFETSTDAKEAIRFYSGQYWQEFGVSVVLKPWKEKEKSQKKKKQQYSGYAYDEDDDNLSTCSEVSFNRSDTPSLITSSCFLLPYPENKVSKVLLPDPSSQDTYSKAGKPIFSESDIKPTDSKPKKKKSTGSTGSYKEEYPVKISGLAFDVREKDILKLVKPFGDLTSPIRIVSYPENGICYAYVDYCSSASAIAAVTRLDKSEFDDVKIHVCHRSKLGAEHSCRKKLQELAEEEEYISVDVIEPVCGTGTLHLQQTGGEEAENAAASRTKKQLRDLPKQSSPNTNDMDTCRSAVDAFPKLLTHIEKPTDTYNLQKQATEKSRSGISYASVTSSPPTPVKSSVGNKSSTPAPKKSGIGDPYSSKYQASSELRPWPVNTKKQNPSINNLPLAGATRKQIPVASNESGNQSLPECVKVLFEGKPLARQPEYNADTVNVPLRKSNVEGYRQSEHQTLTEFHTFSQDSSDYLDVTVIATPEKQLTTKGTMSSTFSTRSSPQTIKMVQNTKPDRVLQLQSKIVPSVRSNCILEVTNLHPDACVQDLERYFKPYGALKAPISIRLHPATDSCFAIVHYVSPDAAQSAMRRLNGCDISGYQMCIVNTGYEGTDVTSASDMSLVVSDSVAVNDVSPVSSGSQQTPSKKIENDTTLSIQKIGFPIIKSISKNLQQFLKEQLSDKITELQQLGGNIEWSDSSVIISGAGQTILDNFDNDVLCPLEEKTECLLADQWNKLMHVRCDDTSFLSQLNEEFSSKVKIDLDFANKMITFVGMEKMVLKARQKLFKEICQELSMQGYQMLVLITCIPNLVEDIATRWKVTVSGFVEGSTCLNFHGDDIQLAYMYVTECVGFCRSKEFPCCNIDVSLVTVAIAYIKRVGISAVVCNTSGERLFSNAKIVSTDVLVVHSLSVKEIDRAICVLESSPHKKEVELSSKDTIDKLKESIEEFQATYCISIQASTDNIVIQGYEEKDVLDLYEKLKKLIDDLTIRTVEFDASKEKLQFLKHVMFDKPTKRAKTLLPFLSKSVSLKAYTSPVTITLTGSLRAIEEATRVIEQELLQNFQVEAVQRRCHLNFLSQIEQFVKEPLEKELNVVVYYFPVHGTERFEPSKTMSIYTKVYSTDSVDFEKAHEVLTKLDPRSHFFQMGEEEFRCIASACDDGSIDLHKIGDPCRTRIELRHNQCAVMMHAFTQQEAENCLQSLRQHMASLKIVIHINLTPLQLEYMKTKKQDVLKRYKATIESAPPKLKLEGMRSQVERNRKQLLQVLNSIVSRSHKHTHDKYILMWKKCWQELHDKICEDKKLYVEFTSSVSDGNLTCELMIVGDDAWKVESVISSVRKIDGSNTEHVISTDAMGVKIYNEGLKSGKIKVRKNLIYHVEVMATNILIASPYSMQAEETHKTIEEFISSEKEKRQITKKLFSLKYSFLAKKLKSDWNKVQEIAKTSKILSIALVTDPCCGVEIKGNEAAIKQAGPLILQHISSLESDVICTVIPIGYYSRPTLASPQLLQLCKELESDFSISLTLQACPEVLASANVQINTSSVKVEICEGSICLDNSEAIVNFTDVTLTVHQELKAVVGESAVIDSEHHIEHCGPQSQGKAINFYKFDDNKNPMVIHAVMPDWIDGRSGESDLIIAAVTESLNLAAECNITSVSLPYLSSVDKGLSVEFLAEALLSAVHNFCEQKATSIEKIRFVLPPAMAKKFEDKFTVGLFQEWIVAQEASSRSPSPFSDAIAPVPSKSVKSFWMWQDDDGKYHPYQTADNDALNQQSAVNSTCTLSIGRFTYEINFFTMTQTNTSTLRIRHIKKLTNDHRWLYRNRLQKWEKFSLKDSIKIEMMYVTGVRSSHVIDGETYTYDFDSMTQINKRKFSKTDIKRAAVRASSTKSKQDTSTSTVGDSKVVIFGSSTDVTTAKEKLEDCIRSLSIVKCIDIQPKLVPELEKHIQQIQKDYRVEIQSWSDDPFDLSDAKAKYNIIGYKTCVQEAITAVYQILASSSTPSVAQSITRPIEWEPQSDPIELKDVSQGSSEWNKILRRMQETIPSVNLVSIKRIQNENLWEKYCQHKERMGRKGLERINEMELFHGSSSNPPEDIYMSEEGFDMRFSQAGMWGQGNYFAESAQYSRNYAYTKRDPMQSHSHYPFVRYSIRSSNTVYQVFLVKVLTGDSHTCPSNNSLHMPPFKPSKSSEKVRYDTVNGVTSGSRVYITYSNDKAYPLYLISFT